MNEDIVTYRDLEAWKVSMDLCELVYEFTRAFPDNEQYGLTSQLRRAVVSIPSNIAEGQGRKGAKEFLHHLSIAKGSLCEIETQIILAVRLKFLDKAGGEQLWNKAQEAGRLLNGLIRSLRK
jgi:four helix bundle protein